jgi:P4 family phage/plasmid primase-like protien
VSDLAKLLVLLERGPDERLSINVRRNGTFKSRVLTVADIANGRVPPDEDVWYGVAALHGRVNGGRGNAKDVVGIRELSCDLDVKPGGLPGWDIAEQVIDTLADMLGTAPVAVVNSGHGLQPHWLLERSDRTDWPDEHDPRWLDAVALNRRWGRLVTAVAERYGGRVDTVSDLSRVLRAPGTTNNKSEPVPVTVTWGHPIPVSIERVLDTVDEYGVDELAGDRDALGKVVAPPADWTYSDRTCGYVAAMTAGWANDTPDARHPWLTSQAVRLGCAHRLGCITSADHQAATEQLIERFSFLVTDTGDRRGPHPGEIADVFSWAVARVATLTDDQARRELGNHSHGDNNDDAQGALPDGHRATDVGNAARLLEHANGRLRYVHAWGKWLVWRGGRWVIDDNDALVTKMSKGVARGLFKLLPKAKNTDERERIWNWAIKSESAGAIAAMIRLARGDVLVEHEDLDANPYLLNVRNGTIDLRTGQLRPADPTDLCTLQCPVAYKPNTRAPLWETCVERWQPDPEVRQYVQIRAGAGATGKPTETVDVDYGSGGNGKSKFWGAIQHVLGPYATIPHKSLLVSQRHEQHSTVVVDLFRVRLAVASETKATDSLEDESVKNLTGGDRLKGRRMREDPWEFAPTHTLVMFSNHRPTVRGRDEGIWRRLRLVPWEVTIPEDERDDHLATKLEAEAEGILRWVVDGARQFITSGLTPPDAVRAATDRYRADEDVIGRFIHDVLRIGDGWAYSSDIKDELDAWCAEQDIDPPRMNEITEQLRNLGCRDGGRRKIGGKRSTIWHGARIAEIKADAVTSTCATHATLCRITLTRARTRRLYGTGWQGWHGTRRHDDTRP